MDGKHGILLDERTDEKTANRNPISLLSDPQNKTSAAFNKCMTQWSGT
jgi:hypothetical protein